MLGVVISDGYWKDHVVITLNGRVRGKGERFSYGSVWWFKWGSMNGCVDLASEWGEGFHA